MTETFEHKGFRFHLIIEDNDFYDPPWEISDSHGIVSDWTTRSKAPGERVLSCSGSSYRYYDWEGTIKRARAEKWGISGPTTGLTSRQITELAVKYDYEYLLAYCNNEWSWVGYTVTLLDSNGEMTKFSDSVWGFESFDEESIRDSYLEVCDELIDQYNEIVNGNVQVTIQVDSDIVSTIRNSFYELYGIEIIRGQLTDFIIDNPVVLSIDKSDQSRKIKRLLQHYFQYLLQ